MRNLQTWLELFVLSKLTQIKLIQLMLGVLHVLLFEAHVRQIEQNPLFQPMLDALYISLFEPHL